MKTRLFIILGIISSSAFFSSCTEEEIKPLNTKEVHHGGGTHDEDVDSL